jgi:hypothetical protein
MGVAVLDMLNYCTKRTRGLLFLAALANLRMHRFAYHSITHFVSLESRESNCILKTKVFLSETRLEEQEELDSQVPAKLSDFPLRA